MVAQNKYNHWQKFKKKPKRKQHERLEVRRPIVAFMREMKELNQFRFPLTWTCPPDSGALTGATAASFKADGYERGVFDMTITASDGVAKVWMVEFKWGNNGYTDEQQAIADMFEGTAVQCLKVYSPDEFAEFAKREFLK
jgi:hypothetical protein